MLEEKERVQVPYVGAKMLEVFIVATKLINDGSVGEIIIQRYELRV
jgi:hypothetical protein